MGRDRSGRCADIGARVIARDDRHESRPPIRSFGRRKGRRLRPGRKALFDRLLPTVALTLPSGGAALDLTALFPRPMSGFWLEIGFGAGEHLAWQAGQNPDIGMLGCEPFVNGVSSLLRRIDDRGLVNIRIHADDARPLIAALPDASIDRCFLLFPDPWPKTRHHRRRFVQRDTLDMLARILADEAEFRVASDDSGLIDWVLYHLRRHESFRWTAGGAADWRSRPPDWPPTRYEAKALQGQPVYLTFRRIRRSR